MLRMIRVGTLLAMGVAHLVEEIVIERHVRVRAGDLEHEMKRIAEERNAPDQQELRLRQLLRGPRTLDWLRGAGLKAVVNGMSV